MADPADTATAGDWSPTPARGYSWQPFTEGHTLSTKHGAWSPRKVNPLAREILEGAIGEGLPAWWQPSDWPAVWAWARAEARVQLIAEWLAERGDIVEDGDHAGSVRPAAKLLTELEASAARRRAELGLTPASRAKLSRDTAAASVDVAALFERLARAEVDQAEAPQ